jgi:ABC-type bacteriocin/lantibiotic exporter with double-glycine peptidase domain
MSLSPAPSPSSSPDRDAYILAIAHLSTLTDVPFDRERATQAVDNALRSAGDPLELLTAAAEEVCLHIAPTRTTIADAVWKANVNMPIIAWSPTENRWIVIRKHGFFRARVSAPDRPVEIATLSRTEIARRLGLASHDSVIEVGIVSPERPAEPTSHAAHPHQHAHISPARRFLGLMRPEMPDVWTIILFSLVTGLLYLALPLAVNALVSNVAFGTQSGPFLQALLVLATVLFICLSIAAALRGLQYYVVEVIQRRLFVRMTADLSYRIPRINLRSIDGVHAPELVNRFLDVVTMQKNTALLLLTGINLVLSTVIGMVVLGFYHPFLLAFSLVLLTFLSFIIFVLGRGAVATSIAESLCKYGVVGWLEEIARCPRLFKGPGGYQLATNRADDLARSYLEARRRHFKILMGQITGLLVLEVIASATLLSVGGWLVINQQLTLGQLVASEIIVSAIVASISKLGKQFEAWYDTLAAVDKLGHLVDLEIEREDGDSPLRLTNGARIQVSDVAFEYSPGKPIFSNVNFCLEPGECVALYGSQGSGSSTMLDLLHGLRMPTEGHIVIDQLDLRGWYLESLRSQVTLIRSADLVNGTIAENVRLGHPDVSIYDVNAALSTVGLLQDVLDLPEGINTTLLAGGLPLSSRQRIRLLIARALVSRPRLLLLDEILDGLDKNALTELSSILLDPSRNCTVLISTREEAVIRRCTRLIDLDDPECHLTKPA